MIDFLLGVPGQIKTLLDRLTATWAAKVDTLHDTRLTSARAGYLDKLNITGNVASQSGGMAGTVKSIQRGFISLTSGTSSGTSTITAVNTAKATVELLGIHGTQTAAGPIYLAPQGFIELFDATTVKFTADRPSGFGGTFTAAWQVVEYW